MSTKKRGENVFFRFKLAKKTGGVVEIDEDLAQLENISKKVAETVLESFRARFKKFDRFEKSVILCSLAKILTSFLLSLTPDERWQAIHSIMNLFNQMYDFDVHDDQNAKF